MLARQAVRRLFSTETRRNALRVENQGKTWNHLELDKHANAFGLGMQELGLKSGDKIVTWLDPKHGLEAVTIQYGCMRSGITLHPVFGDNPDEFFSEISSSGAKVAIISPNRRVNGNEKQSDVLLKKLGELKTHHTGSPLNLKSHPQLRFLIQTGFYAIPGVHKFRDVLLYSNKNFLAFNPAEASDSSVLFSSEGKTYTHKQMKESAKKVSDQEGEVLAVFGDPNKPEIFASGVLPAILSNKYSIIFDKMTENILPVLRSVANPLVVHDQNTDRQLLDVAQ